MKKIYCLILVFAFACAKKEKTPPPVPVPPPAPKIISFSVVKGKEIVDAKNLTVTLTELVSRRIEIKWKYTERGLNAGKYGDKTTVFIGIPSPDATPKKQSYAYKQEKTIGLLEESYWEETFFADVCNLYQFKKGLAQVPIQIRLKSSKGKTIADVVLLAQIAVPPIYKASIGVKNIALTAEGCTKIGDEKIALTAESKVAPDLMFTISTENTLLYQSETTKNVCQLNREFLFDIYCYSPNEKLILRLYDEDYGFNPSDAIALWNLPLPSLSGNQYTNIGPKPDEFFDVKVNPVAGFYIKGSYAGQVN